MAAPAAEQRQQGERGEGDRRERRIGERQVEPRLGLEHRSVGIQRFAVQPGPSAHAVDVDVDAVGDVAEQSPAGPDDRRKREQLEQPPRDG